MEARWESREDTKDSVPWSLPVTSRAPSSTLVSSSLSRTKNMQIATGHESASRFARNVYWSHKVQHDKLFNHIVIIGNYFIVVDVR